MSKQKKITIKPFLNMKLEPISVDENGKDMYPLYFQVTYNRANTQLKSYFGDFYVDLTNDEVIELIAFETKILEKIIKYETRNDDFEFDLKGLKAKYQSYSISIHTAYDEYLKEKLYKSVIRTKNELFTVLNFKGYKCNFSNLYKASLLLFPNLKSFISKEFNSEIEAYEFFCKLNLITNKYDFPTLIDWKDESFKFSLQQMLSKAKVNSGVVLRLCNSIDSVVDSRLTNI